MWCLCSGVFPDFRAHALQKLAARQLVFLLWVFFSGILTKSWQVLHFWSRECSQEDNEENKRNHGNQIESLIIKLGFLSCVASIFTRIFAPLPRSSRSPWKLGGSSLDLKPDEIAWNPKFPCYWRSLGMTRISGGRRSFSDVPMWPGGGGPQTSNWEEFQVDANHPGCFSFGSNWRGEKFSHSYRDWCSKSKTIYICFQRFSQVPALNGWSEMAGWSSTYNQFTCRYSDPAPV